MGTAVRTAETSPASWDAFVDEVLAELAVMEGTKPTRSGPKPSLTKFSTHIRQLDGADFTQAPR